MIPWNQQYFMLPATKPPWDSFFAEIDASNWLEEDTLIACNFRAIDSEGNPVDVVNQSKSTFTDKTIKPYIEGGQDGGQYTIICEAETDAGDKLSCAVGFFCRAFS